jgi:ABC-type transport system involved in cytochrome bd biosynthesis fused ATPase/permease subunit
LAWEGALADYVGRADAQHRRAIFRIKAVLTMNSMAPVDQNQKVRIDIQNLSFYYGAFKALKNVSLPLYDRKVTAFIGPSGCGKSTLLRVLNRIYELYPKQRAKAKSCSTAKIFSTASRTSICFAPNRHGVPETHAVSHDDLRQHRVRH